jgi:phosphoserine phosphatase RsbU/P
MQFSPAARTKETPIHLILVVDDDLTSRLLLESILRREGFQVISATSGEEGRIAAAKAIPDLILMDINMPGEDGLTACQTLKANSVTADCPVVFVSAMEDTSSKLDGFDAGGVDYITKPFDPAEVLARVRLHIRLSHAYQAMVNNHLSQLKAISYSQQILLPTAEAYPEAKFRGLFWPCHTAGGDFFDVIHSAEGVFDYLVADVSGHDIGTALPTAALKALIHQNAEMLYSPIENIRLLNRHLRPVLADGQYATLLYARLNRKRHKLVLINAGHPPALLIRGNGSVEILFQKSEALGMFETIDPDALELDVKLGDKLLLYSDGLIEQGNSGFQSRQIGINHLVEICTLMHDRPFDNWLKEISTVMLPNPAEIDDDVLALAIEV